MIPFRVSFRPGASLCEQLLYAAKRAIIAGNLRVGDQFPSVRALSREFKINPNTAHKVVSELVSEGMLEVRVGVGTVVAELGPSSAGERSKLLKERVEELAVEAKKLGMRLEDVMTALERHWNRLDPGAGPKGG
jgi:GntR family transcriptional regulator